MSEFWRQTFAKASSPLILDTPSALLKRHGYKGFNLLIAYRRAEYVPNKAAELIPTAKPIIKPTLTRSKQLGCGGRCILVSWVELSYEYERSKGYFAWIKESARGKSSSERVWEGSTVRLLGVVRGRCAPTVRACFRFENREKTRNEWRQGISNGSCDFYW